MQLELSGIHGAFRKTNPLFFNSEGIYGTFVSNVFAVIHLLITIEQFG